jgi:hypothetical protein
MTVMTVTGYLLQWPRDWGVETVFGFPVVAIAGQASRSVTGPRGAVRGSGRRPASCPW